MSDRAIHRFDVDSRVQTFGKKPHRRLHRWQQSRRALRQRRANHQGLDTTKAQQNGGTATAKEVLLDALRLDLQNIARTAEVAEGKSGGWEWASSAVDAAEPGFADKFRTPDSPSQTALLTAGDSVVLELTKPGVPAKFIAYEMPADFVQDLKDDLAAIRAADSDMDSDDREGVASTAAVGRLIKSGMAEVTQLDAIVNNKYARNPEKLRTWESASHIERAPKQEKKPAGGANTGGTAPKP